MTKLTKIEYLTSNGTHIEYHRRMQKTGFSRLYIDKIEEVTFTTSTTDQSRASSMLDVVYWSAKLSEDVEMEKNVSDMQTLQDGIELLNQKVEELEQENQELKEQSQKLKTTIDAKL